MEVATPETVEDLQKIVKQLEFEAKMERSLVSESAETIIAFCNANGNDDPLLTGIQASMNPFKEKKSCGLL